MKENPSPTPIESPLLREKGQSRVSHGFFTRQGGVSEGIYAGLNVGIGSRDDSERVRENRARVAGWFGYPLERLATVHQVHSPDVVVVDASYAGERPQADAIATASPGVVLGVLSADCGPILFCDGANGVIGAAHAGWKGALGGVLENTIDAMVALGAEREKIVACLGPSIGPASYEVGPEFVERFLSFDAAYEEFFSPSERQGHACFDLPALTIKRLTDAGVQATTVALDTYPDEERFFSYRRTTHRGEPDYGRQISAIAITEE
ncbi:peptidoglycan editing factor PgeF [Neorhizobium sp. T786]|uniref:peptidoglycan editing factor PgeF n=1 Tax=Pseudorhizobium xiangyangii TaxID=2883104 RepID=UPI001CFF601B|nr:peptidoglycan editing factor PgeF [Neorhizobium xiangyangii]MCB5201353.1 peptidoglycan editing factor PgeF [Neorhizobium xiangyangii]